MRGASGARNTNLRSQTPGFVGREADLQRIGERFATGDRLVSLVGSGGMGKTRLAAQFGHQRMDDYRGVWFADLTEARDLDGVCAAVARELGVPLAGEGTSAHNLAHVGDALAERGRVLVIVDNCEHVIDATSAALARWLGHAPDAQFLATSRERLRLDGEVSITVGPLPAREAVALFVDRATRIAGDLELDETDERAITRIVEQLDGMPLAIELAASRAAVLPPAALLERLSERFEVLTGGQRGGDPRHRTLRATLDWSWNLLEPWERAAMAQFSVFRGGFTLGAAESVVDVSDLDEAPTALGVVQSLLDKSLLHANQEGRFGVYLSVREYAAERLDERGDAGATRARHSDHYLALGTAAAGTASARGEAAAFDALRAEEDNLTAVVDRGLAAGDTGGISRALRALLALEPLRTAHGPFAPYRAQLDAAIAAPAFADLDASLRARAFVARGRIHGYAGRLRQAVADLSTAVDLATGANDAVTEGRALLRLGMMHASQGDFDVSRAVYERALELLRRVGDRLSEGHTLENLAVLYGERGKFDEARRHFAAAREIYVEAGDSRQQAMSLANLGTLLMDEGRLDEARLHFERAVTAFDEIGDRRAYGFFTGHLGAVDQMEGHLERAAERYERAAAIARDMGDGPFEAEHIGYLATVLAARNEVDRATELLARAEDLLAECGDAGAATARGVHEGHVELARARRARANGRNADADAHVAAARRRLDALFEDAHVEELQTPQPHKARVAVRLLELALGTGDAAPAHPADALVIGPDARWFRPPGGDPVDLFRRKTLRRILHRLAEQHAGARNLGLTVDDLLAAGWPGERVAKQAGANRVRVALATLRKLGLKDVIQSRADGYALAPDLDVRHDARINPG